jgi:hypothetical protein
MDQGVQAVEEVDPVGDESLAGRTAQPCAQPAGKLGRPKKLRSLPPKLARELALVLAHFFPLLAVWLGEVRDPRQSGRAVFPIKVLLLLGTLMFLAHTGSRNHFNDNVRDALEMARSLARILGCELESLPHLDTLEKVLRRVDPDTLETVLAQMIRRLIRMKALDDWRVGGQFLLAIDGTGLYSFAARHCAQCIETHHQSGVVTYSHKVLVAFIVSDNGYALPIGCEFIENPGAVYNKQDCEIKAFHRLEPKLKRLYPQTPFWLLLDALYADQNVLRPSLRNGWNVAVTFMDSDMPALWTEGQSLLALSPGQRAKMTLPKNAGTRELRWVNGLEYEGMELSAVFQVEKDKDGNIVQQFAHLLGKPIDPSNAWQVAAAARLRWRCENEGFNVLKNGGFALEHVYSHHPVASKGYFFLMLFAHLFQQLLTRGRLGTVFKQAFNTFLTYGKQMLEALKNQPLPPELDPPGQIRLSTS